MNLLWRRSLQSLPLLFLVSVFTFLIVEWIPGDPALALLGPMATEENLAEIREEMNLDAPLHRRYLDWAGRLLAGDWGRSLSLERPVREVVVESLGATAVLASLSWVLAVGLGLAGGIYMAVHRGRKRESVLSYFIMTGVSTPSFWLGLLLVYVFSIQLGWLPSSGMAPITAATGSLHPGHLVLPSITLALVAASLIARILRARLIEVFQADYIRTFRSAGLSESHLLWRHALPNALVPMIPLLGLQAGYVIGGAVYVETIFEWPGLGRLLVQAIAMRDVQLVQAGVLVIAVAYIFINLLADFIQGQLDRRIQ